MWVRENVQMDQQREKEKLKVPASVAADVIRHDFLLVPIFNPIITNSTGAPATAVH